MWTLRIIMVGALAACTGQTPLYPRAGTEPGPSADSVSAGAPVAAAVRPGARADTTTVAGHAGTIRGARLAQNQALRAGDIDRAATFWASDIVVLAGLGARLEGIVAVRQAFATDGSVIYERTPDEIQVSDAWPIAWERGRWRGIDTATDSALITGWYSARWVRSDIGWRIQSEHFVADRCFGAACRWPLAAR
jgi:ketosteroid isomerase-like protein